MKSNEKKDEDKDAAFLMTPPPPFLIRPLLSLYGLVPKIRLPGLGNFNIAFATLSALALGTVRMIVWDTLLKIGWPANSKMTTDAAASLGSLCHSMILVFHLCIILAFFVRQQGKSSSSSSPSKDQSNNNNKKQHPHDHHYAYIPSAPITAFPQWWQDAASALLEFCTGYMIFSSIFLYTDAKVTLRFEDLSDFDVIILIHHALTSFYMISCSVVGAGHLSALMCMFLGEITNPFMNGMLVTRFAIQLECCNSDTMILIHTFLEHAFAVSYLTMRVVIGPIVCLHLTYDLVLSKHGRQNVPLPLSLIWVTMIWLVIHGSIPFLKDCLEMVQDGFWTLKYNVDYDFGERFEIRHHLEL